MSTYTFRKIPDPDNSFDRSTVEHSIEAESLQDLMEEFENFLHGCGFSFDGHVEVVDEDDYPSVDDEDKESEELNEEDFEGHLDEEEDFFPDQFQSNEHIRDALNYSNGYMSNIRYNTVFINPDSESVGSQTVDMSDVKHNHLYNIEPRTSGYSRKYDFTDEELKNIKSSVSEDVSIVYTGPNDKIPKGTLV